MRDYIRTLIRTSGSEQNEAEWQKQTEEALVRFGKSWHQYELEQTSLLCLLKVFAERNTHFSYNAIAVSQTNIK